MGHWAVWVDESWRLTFRFDGADAARVRARRDPLGYAFFDIRDDA